MLHHHAYCASCVYTRKIYDVLFIFVVICCKDIYTPEKLGADYELSGTDQIFLTIRQQQYLGVA